MKKENLNNIKGKAYYQGLKARYLNAAKEASGDRVLKEYNLQFAEHYSRIISEKFPPQQQQFQQLNSSLESQNTAQSEGIIENKAKCTNRKIIKKPKTKTKESETIS